MERSHNPSCELQGAGEVQTADCSLSAELLMLCNLLLLAAEAMHQISDGAGQDGLCAGSVDMHRLQTHHIQTGLVWCHPRISGD